MDVYICMYVCIFILCIYVCIVLKVPTEQITRINSENSNKENKTVQ